MAIFLKVSNVLTSLSDDLNDALKSAAGHVFLPHYIVTQTEGMNIWLKQQIASQLGIAANINFRKPNDLIVRVYQLLGGAFPDTLSRESLVWFLYQLMGQREFSLRYPIQAAYFNVSGPERDMKRMGLAEKMADLFDQYQIYRPELIKDWNRLEATTPNLDWQAFLWIKARKLSSVQLPDKTFISDYILEQLQHPAQTKQLRLKLRNIYIFGLSIITRYHLNLLTAIAEVTDVHFYLLNPAPDLYWQDDKNERDIAVWRKKGFAGAESMNAGNPLLTSWGKVLQNTFRLLFRNEELLNNYDILASQVPEPDCLLRKIQSDIYYNETENRQPVSLADLRDESITIQSNYTIAREVESLYQYLVHLVDQRGAQISPRDVVVMVSDINVYAPYIKAVFENAAYRFRYKIADLALTQGDNIYSALQQVLQLNESNFTAESVMQLLDSALIRKRFHLRDIAGLRALTQAANIRFGMEGDHADETRFVSWEYGLKRIMFGLCQSGEELYDDGTDAFYPLDMIEGSDITEAVRFCHFVSVLISSIKARKQDRVVGDWVRYVEMLVTDLIFLPGEEPNEDFSHLTDRLMRYTELSELMDEPVRYEIFAHNIVSALDEDNRSSLFMNDGITFCSLIPMRSIPFTVVAMLGLDHDKFPRKEKQLSFNFITQKHELGDRNIKDNDKHLFLETVLSAKDYLYISYLGKSVSDNTDKPPSILVEELISYIQGNFTGKEKVETYLVRQQPLHSFSGRFNQTPELYYYKGIEAAGSRKFFRQEQVNISNDYEEIGFRDILSFYRNSLKAYYNKTLGIYYETDEILLRETELFELKGLEHWALKNALLSLESEDELPDFRNRGVRTGGLPLKNIGAAVSEEIFREISPTLEVVKNITRGMNARTESFQLYIDGSTVTGQIPHLYHQSLIQVCWSGNIVRYMMEAYLYGLAGRAAGLVEELVMVSEKNETGIYPASLGGVSASEATERLRAIVRFYKKGLREKVFFSEHLYRDIKGMKGIPDKALELSVEKKILNAAVPIDDPYISKEYELGFFRKDGIADGFSEAFVLVIEPLTSLFKTYEF